MPTGGSLRRPALADLPWVVITLFCVLASVWVLWTGIRDLSRHTPPVSLARYFPPPYPGSASPRKGVLVYGSGDVTVAKLQVRRLQAAAWGDEIVVGNGGVATIIGRPSIVLGEDTRLVPVETEHYKLLSGTVELKLPPRLSSQLFMDGARFDASDRGDVLVSRCGRYLVVFAERGTVEISIDTATFPLGEQRSKVLDLPTAENPNEQPCPQLKIRDATKIVPPPV